MTHSPVISNANTYKMKKNVLYEKDETMSNLKNPDKLLCLGELYA